MTIPLSSRRKTPCPPAPGPLANLEAHVSPRWWDEIFDELYLKTDGDVVENAELTCREVDLFLDLLPLEKDAAILDVCCGQGRHTLELARRGFTNLTGVDRSAFLLQQASLRAQAAGLAVRFHEADARNIPLSDESFDAALLLGNSFGYFASASDDAAMLCDIHRILRSGGKLLLDVSDGKHVGQHFEPRSWEWIAEDMFTCRERTLSATGDRLITREMTAHVERGVVADRFYAERLYDEVTMVALLTRSGFAVLQGPAQFASTSTRNQDLGMMAQRLIFVAERLAV
ncbi:MAG: class I SAM-dependent methyltransferase [Methylobacteriaceae bacterium]|nr:class I SAM-dependent methyltransferase [Methylobacteriaceae bacterium]